MYPIVIPAWIGRGNGMKGSGGGGEVDVKTKKRQFGRFIGLRGCESPTLTNPTNPAKGTMDVDRGTENESESESLEEMIERMEREWNQGIHHHHQSASVDSDTVLRWKAGGM